MQIMHSLFFKSEEYRRKACRLLLDIINAPSKIYMAVRSYYFFITKYMKEQLRKL